MSDRQRVSLTSTISGSHCTLLFPQWEQLSSVRSACETCQKNVSVLFQIKEDFRTARLVCITVYWSPNPYLYLLLITLPRYGDAILCRRQLVVNLMGESCSRAGICCRVEGTTTENIPYIYIYIWCGSTYATWCLDIYHI